MANYLGFIDESGVLANDPNQNYFGLGLLVLEATGPFYRAMARIKEQAIAALPKTQSPFEFKFNKINWAAIELYRTLIDTYFAFPDARFCAYVVDKKHPNYDGDVFPGTWTAQINYSKSLLLENVAANDSICVIADYLSKPTASALYYEKEIAELSRNGRNFVFNCCMLESHASIFIQVVDVLLGAVLFKHRMQTAEISPNKLKASIVERVEKKLRVPNLADDFSVARPNVFRVMNFDPK